jgi:glucokinase
MHAPVAIGLDVGGTKILSGLVARDGSVLAEHEAPSPDGSEEGVLAALDEAVEALLDERVAAIGYGIPANLERGTGRILRSMNLPLDDVDLVSRSRERFGLPAGIENDGSAATLAEWRRGVGDGTQNLVMLTLGTGVGGGIVIDGRLFRGWAELGHLVVQEGGPTARAGDAGTSRCWRPGQRAIGRHRSSGGGTRTPTRWWSARTRETVKRARRSRGSAARSVPRSRRS